MGSREDFPYAFEPYRVGDGSAAGDRPVRGGESVPSLGLDDQL